MESDVAYVRQKNEDEGSVSYSTQYAAYDTTPSGYTVYGESGNVETTEEGFAPPAHVETDERPTTSAAVLQIILSYWFGFIGACCVIFIGSQSTFILHHAWQGLFVSTALWIICLCMVWNWIAILVAFIISSVALAALTAKAIFDIESGNCFKLPLIGNLCFRLAQNKALNYTNTNPPTHRFTF